MSGVVIISAEGVVGKGKDLRFPLTTPSPKLQAGPSISAPEDVNISKDRGSEDPVELTQGRSWDRVQISHDQFVWRGKLDGPSGLLPLLCSHVHVCSNPINSLQLIIET